MRAVVYILHSVKLNNFYTGFTSELEIRLDNHIKHLYGSRKFTSKADDWTLFLTIECDTLEQAKLIEAHIKRMKSKIYIQNLKQYPEMIEKLLKKYF